MKSSVSLFAFLLLLSCFTACHKSNNTPTMPVAQDTLLAWQKITGLTNAEDIWFVSPSKGFVCGNNTIYSSQDSGKTWTSVPGISANVYNLWFFDTQTGAAIGNADLYVTVNGGAQWTRKPMPATSPGLVDIQFTSSSTAYINTGYLLYKSTDTCNTWTKVFSASYLGGMFFFNSNQGLLVQSSAAGLTKNIVQTTDAAAHWQDFSGITDLAFMGSFMHFSDPVHGWLTNYTVLYNTIDAGTTWSVNRHASNFIWDVFFINSQTGYYALSDEIFKTTDGGQTWTRSCKLGKGGIFEIFFIDEKTGWACCENGSILRLKL
jgi:photosystem II stability/assembly factor-like uncharacterized protein